MSVKMLAGKTTCQSVDETLSSLHAGDILDRTALYIDGAWVASDGDGIIEVKNPATELVIAHVVDGVASDVDRAVAAARVAFPAWAAMPAAERAGYLDKTCELLTAGQDGLTELASQDIGAPLKAAKAAQIGLPIFNFGHYAELARTYKFDGHEEGKSLIVREPVGVIGCITPWNFPLHQVTLKVAAALAAGCTVVVKPSEVAPLLVYALAGIFDEIGLPPGVFNLVSGSGSAVGEALVAHRDVDMISFTGSTRAGKQIASMATGTVKRVALELGGKSANVILDDADFEAAVTRGVGSAFQNCGQACTALTRMLVPAEHLAEIEAIAKRVALTYEVGAWTTPASVLGPLINDTQRKKVLGYIETGIAEGAKLITGGLESGMTTGYFVTPTIFSDVTGDMTIAREEIFGPVLSIMAYHDEAEAVQIANDTDYGLAGAVWSGSHERALKVARQLRAGQIQVNGASFNPAAPFGGYKQSGLGREAGSAGLEEFLETKAIQR